MNTRFANDWSWLPPKEWAAGRRLAKQNESEAHLRQTVGVGFFMGE